MEQLTALVEIDGNHCSTCSADGVQVAAGCPLGNGNIRSLGYGKSALTLVDNKTSRSVRVIPTVKTMRRNQESEFLGLRKTGTPASQIDPALSEPLPVERYARVNGRIVRMPCAEKVESV
jgi:formylmethanofuran dehydrogenase subunit E